MEAGQRGWRGGCRRFEKEQGRVPQRFTPETAAAEGTRGQNFGTYRSSPIRRGRRVQAGRCLTTWFCSCGPSSCLCTPWGASLGHCLQGPWPSCWEGVSMNVQPMYLGESAPKELRGTVAMTSAIFTALGIVMGQVVGLRELLGGPQAWPLLLASCLVPGLLQLASLPLLPESPRYLLIDRGDAEACLSALQRLRGTEDLALELAELEEERTACQGLRARHPWELFRDGTLRRQVTSLVVLGSAMELCGNDSVYAYASSVFLEAGVPQEKVQYAIIGTGCCELLMAFVSCAVIERVGRRVLLMGGYCLMTFWGSIFTVALCLQSSFPWMPYLAMSCIFAFILSFGIGPAGVTGILATELFDQTARPAAYMVCGALMWTMLFLVGLGFPFLMEGLSHFLYVPFLGVCVCAAIYTGFFLPETKGKTFLEISEELRRLNLPRRSHGHRWRGPDVIQSTEL
ncbi:solute carrier family 2, facilitated glucose transporter member 11 isoform X6 [Phyllostomus hastatus]|uniref:solute carrier family 2, facilitated glucose transporter member 11 isoform X6 n=1 Tax=Phyllostomus hastatus TaxID=9423 RepID=UPI001E682FF8|nr:solute carrier family 2, facilitated glucose transporter member 11 isoform X6 [Phyllostomus hastatus]